MCIKGGMIFIPFQWNCEYVDHKVASFQSNQHTQGHWWAWLGLPRQLTVDQPAPLDCEHLVVLHRVHCAACRGWV